VNAVPGGLQPTSSLAARCRSRGTVHITGIVVAINVSMVEYTVAIRYIETDGYRGDRGVSAGADAHNPMVKR
jgi:hypothetical protein